MKHILAPCKLIRDPRQSWTLDSMYWIPVFVSGILILEPIPDSLSCIPGFKTQDSRFPSNIFLRNKKFIFKYSTFSFLFLVQLCHIPTPIFPITVETSPSLAEGLGRE